MKIQIFYRFDKIDDSRWRVSADIANTEVVSTISSDDAVKIFNKVISPTVFMPFSFLFVVEHTFDNSVRFTIVSSIDDVCPMTAWIENIGVYNEIMAIIGQKDYNRKYKVLVGSSEEAADKRLIKMIEFLDMVPVISSGATHSNSEIRRERLRHLLMDVDVVFFSKNKKESYTSWNGTEVKICDGIGIPYYCMDEVEKMVVAKTLGEEIKINVANKKNSLFDIDSIAVNGNKSECWENPYYSGRKFPDTDK